MPVEIRELIVRATIAEGAGHNNHSIPPNSGEDEIMAINELTKKVIVEEAVQQVLFILERKKDR